MTGRGAAGGRGRELDWAAIRRRIDEAGRALAGRAYKPGEQREILEIRARALARPAAQARPADLIEAVTFYLGNERYAIESRAVVEVFRLRGLTPLPGATAPVFGVTAWRGQLLTVLDLRSVLGLPVATLNDLHHVIAIGEERAVFGILTDSARDIVTIVPSELGSPSPGSRVPSTLVRGMTNDAMLLLDYRTLLTAGADS